MEQAHGVRVKNLWEKEFGIKILTFSEIRDSNGSYSTPIWIWDLGFGIWNLDSRFGED